MDTIGPEDQPQLIDDIIFLERQGIHIYYNPLLPGRWFGGPPVAGTLLKLCDGTRTVAAIAKETEAGPGARMGLSGDDWKAAVFGLLTECAKKGFFGGNRVEPFDFPLRLAWLHLTRRCNLRCSYCYLSGGDEGPGEMTKAEILDIADQFKAMGGITMALSGGEPLVRDDFFDIIEQIAGKGLNIILATNGSLITGENAPLIKRYVKLVHLSLDGNRQAHDRNRGKGSYDNALRGLGHLRDLDVSAYISAVVTKENMDAMENMVLVAKKYGLKQVKVAPIVPLGRAAEALLPAPAEMERVHARIRQKALDEQYPVIVRGEGANDPHNMLTANQYSCGGGIDSISIDTDGSVYPCQAAHMPEFLKGNLREKPLREIWERPGNFREWREATVDSLEECSECMWRKRCGGGCRINAYLTKGKLAAHDMYCQMYKHSYDKALWARERALRGQQ